MRWEETYLDLKPILIGGSSHVGKTTVAKSLATTLGWTHLSTDSLARHPGRPWRPAPQKVPDHVAQHYLTLSVDELIQDVLHHYKANVWPKVEFIVASQFNTPSSNGIILEGSAIWPDFAINLDPKTIKALWLTADETTFRNRIHTESSYNTKTPREHRMIDKFLDRTLAYNERMVKAIKRHALPLIHVHDAKATDLAKRCLSTLGIDQPTLPTMVGPEGIEPPTDRL